MSNFLPKHLAMQSPVFCSMKQETENCTQEDEIKPDSSMTHLNKENEMSFCPNTASIVLPSFLEIQAKVNLEKNKSQVACLRQSKEDSDKAEEWTVLKNILQKPKDTSKRIFKTVKVLSNKFRQADNNGQMEKSTVGETDFKF